MTQCSFFGILSIRKLCVLMTLMMYAMIKTAHEPNPSSAFETGHVSGLCE